MFYVCHCFNFVFEVKKILEVALSLTFVLLWISKRVVRDGLPFFSFRSFARDVGVAHCSAIAHPDCSSHVHPQCHHGLASL
eukprot:m.169672 g.169672  ORF g.169672 m.169672 type:complete len:81 (-) comp31580_c2_seq1:2794-3036(-)